MTAGLAVSIKGVSKRYPGPTKRHPPIVAVDGLSLEMHAGEVFGFIGPNGAGKSTTIKMMVGLLAPDAGTVAVGGHDMATQREEAHQDLGYLPQQVRFQEWRTVDHALTTFGRLSGLPRGELPGRIAEVLKLLGIEDTRDRRAVDLSGGTLQKVGMAQALLHRPPLVVLDEPMAGLDPQSRFAFKRIIKDLGRAGTSVFFSSHILSDVQDVADRFGIINRARLMWTGTYDDLKAHFKVTSDYDIVLSKDNDGWRALKSLPGVKDIERVSEGRLLAHIDAAQDTDAVAHALLTGLLERGCRVRSFTPASPDLEELYVRYVSAPAEGGGAR